MDEEADESGDRGVEKHGAPSQDSFCSPTRSDREYPTVATPKGMRSVMLCYVMLCCVVIGYDKIRLD